MNIANQNLIKIKLKYKYQFILRQKVNFFQSLDNVIQSIENNNIKTVSGKNKLSIVVENRYEIFLTHYPLWNNEKFLYSIGCMLNKIILEKKIPEELVADKFIELKRKNISQLISKNIIINQIVNK